jgi:hypothetical protein
MAKPSIRNLIKRERRLMWGAIILAANFAIWISAGLYISDLTATEPSNDFEEGWYIAALESVGWGHLFGVVLLGSLAAQLVLRQRSHSRQPTGEKAVKSLESLLIASARSLPHRRASTVHVSGFVHLVVGDYLVPLCATNSGGVYMPDRKSVISLSEAGGKNPFVIVRAYKERRIIVDEAPRERTQVEIDNSVPRYGAIVGAPLYDHFDPGRVIGTISFGSNRPEEKTKFKDAEDTVEKIAEVASYLWALVRPHDPIVRELESNLHNKIRRRTAARAAVPRPWAAARRPKVSQRRADS